MLSLLRLRAAVPGGRLYRVLAWSAIAYLAARLLFLAVTVDPGIPPDETVHVQRIVHYSEYPLLPDDTPASYSLGPMGRQPWLYYFTMGKLLSLNVLPVSDLVFLRLLNALMGLALVLVAWRWMRLVSGDRLAHLLFLVLLSNTPMLSFLWASVSYDNLANLLAVLSIFFLFAFLRRRSSTSLALFSMSAAAGCLTKQTFIPLAVILVLVLAWHATRWGIGLRRLPSRGLARPSAGAFALVLGAATLGGLAISLYAGNMARFGRMVPACEQLLPAGACMQNRIWARDAVLTSYAGGRRSYEEAIRAAKDLAITEDRGAVTFILQQLKATRDKGTPPLNRVAYAIPWGATMLRTGTGILGHKVMYKSAPFLALYALACGASLLAVVAGAARWRRKALWAYAAGIAFAYLLILMQFVNYYTYATYRHMELALQGRYAFPVLILLYGLAAQGLVGHFRSPKARLATAVVVCALFIAGDFPYFLANAPPSWFR